MKRFPTAFTVIMALIAIVAVISYFVPAGQYKYMVEGSNKQVTFSSTTAAEDADAKIIPGTYSTITDAKSFFPSSEVENSTLGTFVNAPVQGFFASKSIILFILILGGFINVAMSTGAIDKSISTLVTTFPAHVFIPMLMIVFAIGGTTYGMGEECIGFYPVLMPILLAAGYDTLTCAAIVLFGAGTGVLASTINPFATVVASDAAGVAMSSGLLLRSLIWVTSVAFVVFYVMRYAASVKADPKNSYVYSTWSEDRKHFLGSAEGKPGKEHLDLTQKFVLTVFILTFVVMCFSMLPFSDWGIEFIPTMGWYVDELSALFLFSSILIGFVCLMAEHDFVDRFLAGVKDIVSVGLIIALATAIKVVMIESRIDATVLHWFEASIGGLSGWIFVMASYFIHIFLSLLIPSSSGLAVFSMPILAPVAEVVGVGRDFVVTAYQSANGLVNLFWPGSAILTGGLYIARVQFNDWMRFASPALGVLFAISSFYLIVGLLFA